MTQIQENYTEIVPIVYDKFQNPCYEQRLPIHIFGTSSKGNSIFIKSINTLIDLGLPFKRYEEYDPNFFLQVDYIFITHEHSDHINTSTFLKILKLYPHVKFIIPTRLARVLLSESFAHRINQDKLRQYTSNEQNRFKSASNPFIYRTRNQVDVYFKPYFTKHGDIINIAIELEIPQFDTFLLYASDLDTLHPHPQPCGVCYCECTCGKDTLGTYNGLPYRPKRPYDLIFLEANYDQELIDEALRKNPHDPKARGNLRHISEQEARAYVQQHLDVNGYFVPLHASSVFGTLHQYT